MCVSTSGLNLVLTLSFTSGAGWDLGKKWPSWECPARYNYQTIPEKSCSNHRLLWHSKLCVPWEASIYELMQLIVLAFMEQLTDHIPDYVFNYIPDHFSEKGSASLITQVPNPVVSLLSKQVHIVWQYKTLWFHAHKCRCKALELNLCS